MNTELFYLDEDNKLRFNTHKVAIRHYSLNDGEVDKTNYKDDVQYVNAEGLHELEVNYVPKHKLLEIVEKQALDTSEYAWMEGIEIAPDADRAKQIERIASCGSMEVYQASLPEYIDEYVLDLETRLSMIEMGV